MIISPHFPPINAPDMHRIRMSLPFYEDNDWEAVVIGVDDHFVEGFRDPLLLATLPESIEIHRIGALSSRWTRKIGLGSLSMRSYFHFRKKGNELLSKRKFDLVFFSTSMFHVVALGPYWKRKYGVPFVVDMQDPWRNDYYLEHPELPRPPKFRMAYEINKWLESKTMPFASGLMSVSEAYIKALRNRYPSLSKVPARVIPFSTSFGDFRLVERKSLQPAIEFESNKINVVYIGAFPVQSFLPVLKAFFLAFKREVQDRSRYKFYFIGTNYAPGQNRKPIEELASEVDLGTDVVEMPSRIPYFTTLATLKKADLLLILGSVETQYNASKLYNYLLSGRPIFSIFHESAIVTEVLLKSHSGLVATFKGDESEDEFVDKVALKMPAFQSWHENIIDTRKVNDFVFTAEQSVRLQVQLFEDVLAAFATS